MHQNSICNSEALKKGNWVKLICGASNQDLPAIADLCAIYATAGVNCIDVAADAAVFHAAREAINLVETKNGSKPWLMISISDGKDEHFRKAWFNPKICPMDCPRPCQQICPAKAIQGSNGVNPKRCYGCGRCIPTCPLGLINEQDRRIGIKDFAPLLAELQPDAIEIHTAPGRTEAFENTVSEIMSANVRFKRIAVSCGLQGYGINTEELAKELWARHKCLTKYDQKAIWQLDGRRMSGDLGKGAATVAVSLWKKIKHIAPPGPLQLAGGTNKFTIKYIPKKEPGPAGVAFGGMARKLIQPWLIEAQARNISLRDWPEGWQEALSEANELISPWLLRKTYSKEGAS